MNEGLKGPKNVVTAQEGAPNMLRIQELSRFLIALSAY